MKTAKKAMLLTVCALVLVAATIMGTLAYLTSADEVVNTFTVGKVAITLDEAKVDEKGQILEGEGAGRVKSNDYKLIPGVTLHKDPTVTVLAGSEDCYVRVLVTLNEKAAMDAIFKDVPGHADMTAIFGGMSANWVFKGETDNKDDTHTYELRYKEAVPASSSDTVLAPVFTNINVPGFLTNEQLATVDGFTIDVVAQAIQVDSFQNADTAWAAFPAA